MVAHPELQLRFTAYCPHHAVNEDCTPVDGLSSGFERAEWRPIQPGTQGPWKRHLQPSNSRCSSIWQLWATLLIHHSGRQPADLQLLSVPAKLSNNSLYTMKFSAKANMLATLNVSLIQDSTALPTYTRTAEVTHNDAVFNVADLRPPSSGLYLLAFNLGAVDAGTVLFF